MGIIMIHSDYTNGFPGTSCSSFSDKNVGCAAFPGASGCNSDYYGNDLPAFGSGSAGASAGQVLVNSHPHEYITQCDSKGIQVPASVRAFVVRPSTLVSTQP